MRIIEIKRCGDCPHIKTTKIVWNAAGKEKLYCGKICQFIRKGIRKYEIKDVKKILDNCPLEDYKKEEV